MRVCSSCGTLIPNGASACPGCGAPVGKAASAAGSEAGQELHGTLGTGRGAGKASVPDPYKNAPIHTAPDAAGLKGSLAGGKTGGGGYSGGASGYTGGASSYTGGASGYSGGRVYTEDNSDYDRGEEEYDEYEAPKKRKTALWIILACTLFALAAAMVCVLLFVDFGGPVDDPTDTLPPATRLSDSCDRILAAGEDEAGNFYELVGNQRESATDFTIEVGIIKNNEWLEPLSDKSPFLNEDGTFSTRGYVGGLTKENLFTLNTEHTAFVEGGYFYMLCPYVEDGHTVEQSVFYNCKTRQYGKIDRPFFNYQCVTEARYTEVGTYNFIRCEDGLLTYVVSGEFHLLGEDEDETLFFYDLNTFTSVEVGTFPAVHEAGPLQYGRIAAYTSDSQRVEYFFARNGKQVIDLTGYNLTSGYDNDYPPVFRNGEYCFYHCNDLGHWYRLTIDVDGNVIREEKQ